MKPNIIYILADDMGYGDVSYLNKKAGFKTPNLDCMCETGMAFSDAHSASAVCTPSRYSILTGRYNWRSSLKSGVLWSYSTPLIEKNRKTVASLLKDNGYHTYCVGKWHLGLGWQLKDSVPEGAEPTDDTIDFTKPVLNTPTSYGFDYFYGITASLDIPPYLYIENEDVVEPPCYRIEGTTGLGFYREGPCAKGFKHEEVLPTLTQKTIDIIKAPHDEPFFIYFPLPAPHTPILPSKEFLGKSKTTAYGDFVLMCDNVVGQIMTALEEQGLSEDTIVIFTADNGCSPGADIEGLKKLGHNPSHHFRGMKSDIFEGGHRIPLIVKWKSQIKPSQLCDEIVCLSDFYATVANILGVAFPDNQGEDSVSNLPLWISDSKKAVRETVVHQSIDGSLSIRKGDFKLCFCKGSGGWSYPLPGVEDTDLPSLQLYRLNSDISETENVAEKYPEIVAELTKLMVVYYENGRSTKGVIQKNDGVDYWDTIEWLKEYSGLNT